MVILGIDPGIARTGYGVVDTQRPAPFVRGGCITTPQHDELEDRLVTLANDLETIITNNKPDVAVVEHVFFGKNAKTAMMTAQARGAIILILRRNGIPVESLTPLQIKSRLTGYGAASKQQIQSVVTTMLHLTKPPQPDDAADALAAAVCMI